MLGRAINQYEKSLEDFINEAKKTKAEKMKVLKPSYPLEFNVPYPALCTDVEIEEYDSKTRIATTYRVFNNSFGTDWIERYYTYGGGILYFNALCDVLGTRKIEEFIGKAVLVVLESDGKYTNLRVKAPFTIEELQEEWERLAKADKEAGLINPLTYARQNKEALADSYREKREKVNDMVKADVEGQLDDLDED